MRLLIATSLLLTACSFAKPASYDYLNGSNLAGAIVTLPTTASVDAPQAGQVGVEVQTRATSSATLANPRWDFGDAATATGLNAVHTYSQAGSFTITFRGEDPNGQTVTATHLIEIVPFDNTTPCLAGLLITVPSQIVVGKATNLSLFVPSCLTLTSAEWDFGDNTPDQTGTSITHNFAALGNYTLSVHVTHANGDLTISKSVSVVSADLGTPTGPRNPGDELTDPPTPPPGSTFAGGWYPFSQGFCTGFASYGARVDCFTIKLYCTGTNCPLDGAVAACSYSYNQGAMDWRLNPDLWEMFQPGQDHLPKGWGCQVVGHEPLLNSNVFRPDWYLQAQPDVRQGYGPGDYYEFYQAALHWTQYGANEGRQAAPTFSAPVYLARYADLRAAFGANGYAAGARHFVTYGRAEGRSGL